MTVDPKLVPVVQDPLYQDHVLSCYLRARQDKPVHERLCPVSVKDPYPSGLFQKAFSEDPFDRPSGVVLSHGNEKARLDIVLLKNVKEHRYTVAHSFEGIYIHLDPDGLVQRDPFSYRPFFEGRLVLR